MSAAATTRALVDRIEAAVQTDVGRNIGALCEAARGGLWRAAMAIAASPRCRVGLITGFFVPLGAPPAAETDGPVGAALLARGLAEIGIPSRLATDAPCRNACAVALAAAGAAPVPVDAVAIGAALDPLAETWRAAGVTHALSIERCGRSVDGTPRNMRGQDIGAHTAPLDELFTAGPWETIAVGDGGNEIGMGALPRTLIAAHVEHGATIACVTAAQHLIVAGVSHWGAYALIGALAVVREDWRQPLVRCLDEDLDARILETTLRDGPAVDGVSRLQAPTIDNLDLAAHHRKLRTVRALARQA
ncbi:MAG: glutamate cyclase domain-containing protein [Stellaceae bacterium]